MDKSAIKNFATSARNKLIEGVIQKAYEFGISDKEIKEVENLPDGSRLEINNEYKYLTNSEANNREKLIEQIESKGFSQVIEEVAYTWFNRIIAIRFMEVNDYLPTGVRVLSSEETSKTEPDAVTNAHELIEELELNRDIVFKYQDNNDSEGLFKYILIKQCNELGKIMPVMFEKIEDYTELLLPDNLLVEGSVVRDLVSNISEEDFKEQVEIIGWLYQYYISEKKDEVFADLKKNKKITKENIPAATQLFTPDWIVKYMVENSLGRLWLEGHPNEELQSNWKYYLAEAKQEPDVEKELEKIREESKSLSPEDITVLDPSMGSGHILVYAFDVLYQIYLSAGYSERDIPRLILEKNIYGLDIDDRAGQLAYFALMMKARSYSRRIFRDMERNPISLNVCSIQESNGLTKEDIQYFANGDESLKKDIEYLVEVFTDAKEYGSILEVNAVDFERIENRLKEIDSEIVLININKNNLLDKVPNLVKQGKVMSKKYNIMCTNPPYMGSKGMSLDLKKYLDKNFKNTKSDLFAVFMELDKQYLKNKGYISMINQHSWMFVTSFSELRKNILNSKIISNMIHLGPRAFEEIDGEVVQSTAFIIRKMRNKNYRGRYIRLIESYNANDKKVKFEEILKCNNAENIDIYTSNNKEFELIEGSPITYWTSKQMKNIFLDSNDIMEYIDDLGAGNKTANNDKYLRYMWEVKYKDLSKKWIKYTKGGTYRKWYGNLDYVIDWSNEAKDFYKQNKTSNLLKQSQQFVEGITYTELTTKDFNGRILEKDTLFDMSGPGIIVKDNDTNYYILGLLNSIVGSKILNLLNSSFHIKLNDIARFPFKYSNNNIKIISSIVSNNIALSNKDWNENENTYEFKKDNLVQYSKQSKYIKECLEIYSNTIDNRFKKLKNNEEE